MRNQTKSNATNASPAREGRSAKMRFALNSRLVVAGLVATAVTWSSLAAHGQEAPKRADVADLALAPVEALPSSAYVCPHIAQVCALLADPAIRNHVGFAENTWDFNAPNGVPGFGPIPTKTERTNMFSSVPSRATQ